MVAHNARFDMGFLTRACANLGYDWPSPVCLDTVRLARHIIARREVANYRLGTLAAYFSTATEPSHRALDDARATVEVLHGLLERVGNQGVSSLADLLAYSHTVSTTRRARRVWADDLPDTPGVYLFVRDDRQGRHYLYVGVSRHIRRRVAAYFTAAETRQRMEEMVRLSTGVEAIECHTGLEAAVVEARLIKAHQPPYNRRGKQPRHTWIKVTIEPIPRLSVVRRVLNDQASYCGPFTGRTPAEEAILAIGQAFALRSCTDKLSATTGRPACSLAELASCPAPCTLTHLDDYRRVVDQVKACLAGDVRPVEQACLAAMAHLSSQLRYEQAGELLERWRVFEQAMRRQARLTSLANCSQIVAARRLEAGWEIHVVRHARLAGAGVARPGDDPLEVVAAVLATAQTVDPAVAGQPAGSIEEAELIATWLEQPGVRLIDIQGVWGWPVHTQ
jgi:DNA polymerase-3 subunit epsilon